MFTRRSPAMWFAAAIASGFGESISSRRAPIGRFISMCPSMSASAACFQAGRKIKDYEAGMDLKLATDHVESFKIFQSRILEEYQSIVGEYGLTEIDATQSIGEQQTNRP